MKKKVVSMNLIIAMALNDAFGGVKSIKQDAENPNEYWVSFGINGVTLTREELEEFLLN